MLIVVGKWLFIIPGIITRKLVNQSSVVDAQVGGVAVSMDMYKETISL